MWVNGSVWEWLCESTYDTRKEGVHPSHDQKLRRRERSPPWCRRRTHPPPPPRLIRPEHRRAVSWKPPLLCLVFVCFLRSRFAARHPQTATEDELAVVFVIIPNFSEPCHVWKCRSSEKKACLFVWLVSFSPCSVKGSSFFCAYQSATQRTTYNF